MRNIFNNMIQHNRPRRSKRHERARALIQSFMRDDRGQTTAEYILILAVVVMVAMKFKKTFDSKMGDALGVIGTKMDDALRDP